MSDHDPNDPKKQPPADWFGKIDWDESKYDWDTEQNRVFSALKKEVTSFFMNEDDVMKWFHQRSKYTQGMTPLEHINMGTGQKLLEVVQQTKAHIFNRELKKAGMKR